jgi:hypothetical protein
VDEFVLTANQVAARLQVNVPSARRWLCNGELIGILFGGLTGRREKRDKAAA